MINHLDIETLRIFLTIPVVLHFAKQYRSQYPGEFSNALVTFARKSNAIKENGEKIIKLWLGALGQRDFSRVLHVVKSEIEAYLERTPASDYRYFIRKCYSSSIF